jgi:hypothetical protein
MEKITNNFNVYNSNSNGALTVKELQLLIYNLS